MSQMETGVPEIHLVPVDTKRMIHRLYETFIVPVNSDVITFTCHIAEDIPDDLVLDHDMIQSAFAHIIANSVRFTYEGRIHLHATVTHPHEHGGDYTLTLIIADTGVGMDGDKLRYAFGAGRGLIFTCSSLRSMGGDMTVTSSRGCGSEFVLTVTGPSARETQEFSNDLSNNKPELDDTDPANLSIISLIDDVGPLTNEQSDVFAEIIGEPSTPETISAPQHRGVFSRQAPREGDIQISCDQLKGLNILIVEDVLANQEVLRSLLEPVGCTVSGADNGQEAIDLMEKQIFDVILMDIRMPVMDGVDATKAIRKTPGPQQNVPIIALTADASAENNAQCLAAGADVFLTKPVIVSELLSSIRFVREKQNYQKQKTQMA